MRMKVRHIDAILLKVERALDLDGTGVRKVVRAFHREMKRGLAGRASSLKMLPAYVARPTGSEKGDFLALDLGGTNFRVLEVRLLGQGRSLPSRSMKFSLSKKDICGTGEHLFGFIASSIERFLDAYPIPGGRRVPLGFTFSFPVRQTGVASGELMCWTKGFHARGVVGRDVVACLRRALDARAARSAGSSRGIGRIDIAALVNDTVGTLVARSYADRNCDVGVIIGTGTNACYTERTRAIGKWGDRHKVGGETIVNIEWGNFDKLPRTDSDRALDRRSNNPRRQILEKMVSGMYLGELSRLVLLSACRRRGTGGQCVMSDGFRAAFAAPGALSTADMSTIEEDRAPRFTKTARILRTAGVTTPSAEERELLWRVCRAVSRRAARIAAAGIIAVITSMDRRVLRRHTVAIDGSVYEKHPAFSRIMKETFREILGARSSRIRLSLAKDGSGKGAAIVAAVAHPAVRASVRRRA